MTAVVDLEGAQAPQIRFKAITVTAKTDLPRMAESQYLNDSLVDFFTQMGMCVEEKFPQENFRVLSEMRILGKIRVAILDFGRVSRFF